MERARLLVVDDDPAAAENVKRQAGEVRRATVQEDVYDQALALVQFDRLLTEHSVIPHYQPIVQLSTGEHVSY